MVAHSRRFMRGLHVDIQLGKCGDRQTWPRADDHVQNDDLQDRATRACLGSRAGAR